MTTPLKIVAFACTNSREDRCAPLIQRALAATAGWTATGVKVDDVEVLTLDEGLGQTLDLVCTRRVLSHDFERYLPIINERWGSYDLALVLNWHEGAGGGERVFPVHSTADVRRGIFGPADPVCYAAILASLEASRRAAGLDDYAVTTEATHWSGTMHGLDPSLIARFPVPTYDVEIGSVRTSWEDPRAAAVVADGVRRIAAHRRLLPKVLFVGGIHFDPACSEAALSPSPVAFGHILANQWVAVEAYEGSEGLERLRAAARSIIGGPDAVVFHDKLKGPVKDAARAIANELGVPGVNHRRLRSGLFTETGGKP